MKALRNTAWVIFALSIMGVVAILSIPYYRHFAPLHLLEGYWMLMLFFIAFLMLVVLQVRRFLLCRKAGKKGILPVTGAVLCFALSLVPGIYVVRPLRSKYYLEQTSYRSPDGTRVLYRSTSTDILGNSCYVYGMYGSGLNYREMFDADMGQTLELEWGEDALIFRGNAHPYPQ